MTFLIIDVNIYLYKIIIGGYYLKMNTQERELELKQLALAWKTYNEHFSNCARLEDAFEENKAKRTFWYIREEERMEDRKSVV